MNTSRIHATYSREEALEIIRAETEQESVDDLEVIPFSYCRHLADKAFEFYLKQSNQTIEIELSRFTGDFPTVTDH